MNWLLDPFRHLGARVRGMVTRLGFAARFFGFLLIQSGTSLKRFSLVIREMYFSGVQSLIIITVSAMVVGLVLALPMVETLQRFGSSDSRRS